MTLKEELVLKALGICQEHGIEYGLNWLIDNIQDYYKDEAERLERRIAVRDRLLFSMKDYKITED